MIRSNVWRQISIESQPCPEACPGARSKSRRSSISSRQLPQTFSDFVNRFGGRNGPSTSSLGSRESAMLDAVLHGFFKDTIDLDVFQEATKARVVLIDHYNPFRLAEETRGSLNT